MTLATQPADWLEDEFDRHLFRTDKSLAKMTGWLTYHTLRSRGSKAGYPDRTCIRERVLFAELKREKSKPTAEQVLWLDRLAGAGAEVYLWRPSDLDEIGAILGYRWRYDENTRLLRRRDDPGVTFAPRSMWVPGDS